MKIIRGTSKGFFGNVLDAARHISQTLKNDGLWYVNWDQTPYNDSAKGPNAWEYFFTNKYSPVPSSDIVADYTNLELLDGCNFRQTMHVILTDIISLNGSTQHIVESTRSKLNVNSKTLGLHIRKTDKNIGHRFGEPASAAPLDVSIYIKYIDDILPNFERLYVASDDIDDLNVITSHVKNVHNKKVAYIDAFRSRGATSIHNNYPEISGYRKGLEVLVDCYMLSGCGHIIRSTSNVGSAAQFINLDLTHTNINEIELGDLREREYNL